jgi:hypothetical protein
LVASHHLLRWTHVRAVVDLVIAVVVVVAFSASRPNSPLRFGQRNQRRRFAFDVINLWLWLHHATQPFGQAIVFRRERRDLVNSQIFRHALVAAALLLIDRFISFCSSVSTLRVFVDAGSGVFTLRGVDVKQKKSNLGPGNAVRSPPTSHFHRFDSNVCIFYGIAAAPLKKGSALRTRFSPNSVPRSNDHLPSRQTRITFYNT